MNTHIAKLWCLSWCHFCKRNNCYMLTLLDWIRHCIPKILSMMCYVLCTVIRLFLLGCCGCQNDHFWTINDSMIAVMWLVRDLYAISPKPNHMFSYVLLLNVDVVVCCVLTVCHNCLPLCLMQSVNFLLRSSQSVGCYGHESEMTWINTSLLVHCNCHAYDMCIYHATVFGTNITKYLAISPLWDIFLFNMSRKKLRCCYLVRVLVSRLTNDFNKPVAFLVYCNHLLSILGTSCIEQTRFVFFTGRLVDNMQLSCFVFVLISLLS